MLHFFACNEPFVAAGTSIDNQNFDKLVIQQEELWLLEIASDLCGSCQAFAPKWKELVGLEKRVKAGHVIIDNKPGLAVAQQLQAPLELGIPCVVLFGGGTPQM